MTAGPVEMVAVLRAQVEQLTRERDRARDLACGLEEEVARLGVQLADALDELALVRAEAEQHYRTVAGWR